MLRLLAIFFCLLPASFTADKKEKNFVKENFQFAELQLKNMLNETNNKKLAFPVQATVVAV
ncbi:MAG: hypothetical protein WDM90_11755 [Ferruginibacter sp.]